MKRCFFCKYWCLTNQEDDWCLKGHWDLDISATNEEAYRELIRTAETCEHYEQVIA